MQQLELNKTLSLRGSTKYAPEGRRASKRKLMQVEASNEEEGTSNPETQKPEEIVDMFKEQAGEDRIPFSVECEAMEQARD